MEEK
jgi:hypothetical protein